MIYADVFANGVLVDRRAFLGTRGLRAPRLGTLRYRTILRAMARSGCSTACWRNATTGTKRTRPSFLATRPRSTTRSSQTRAMATLRPTSFSTPSKSTSGLSMLMLSDASCRNTMYCSKHALLKRLPSSSRNGGVVRCVPAFSRCFDVTTYASYALFFAQRQRGALPCPALPCLLLVWCFNALTYTTLRVVRVENAMTHPS